MWASPLRYVPETDDLGVGAGLVPVQPGHVVIPTTLLLHLTPLARLQQGGRGQRFEGNVLSHGTEMG